MHRSIVLSLAVVLCGCASSHTQPDGSVDAPADTSDTSDVSTDDVSSDTGCGPDLTECSGVCVDTDTDPDHCGGCDSPCETDEVCSAGTCVADCPAGTVNCSGSCVDTDTDVLHCGGCGHACTAGEHASPVCEMGVCDVLCDMGWADLDSDGSCESDCVPSGDTETCNGVDDDCDGETDEDFECTFGRTVGCTTTCGSTGTGVCDLACEIPLPASCNPPAEMCNGTDDDCDGECDNGFSCCVGDEDSCTADCGSTGTAVCDSTCRFGDCAPPAEVCNGADDDCDGECDNGYTCCLGDEDSCTTTCGSTGTHVCLSSCAWPDCTPPAETCNGADDDCDGECDEGSACCAGQEGTCTTTCGSTGSYTCTPICTYGECIPPAETCNGDDDDCDGACDNGYTCCAGQEETCTTTCGSTGTHTCTSSCTWGTCNPPAETWNLVDDDCDTVVDEGYAVLAHGHDDCTGGAGTCPAGYSGRGSFKVNSITCGDPGSTAQDYDGYSMDAGWMILCSPTDDFILAKGSDDCGGSGGGCPSGYSSRATFKVDAIDCASAGASGVAHDGQQLRSGWMHLCARNDRVSLVLGSDDCTGDSGSCPTGTFTAGVFKPDVVACNPAAPSAVTTGGHPLNSGWLHFCVSN